jgi:hypothetical protein
MMDRDTGESIGDEMGEFMEADVGDDGLAVGKFLRVKVRINIRKPLMRGIMLNVGEGKAGLWSRFEYEFLPNFCYRCGMLDHIDKYCKVNLARGEKAQFGSWLKAYIPRQNVEQSRGQWGGGRSISDGRGSGYNQRYGFCSLSEKTGSDTDNWRKKGDDSLISNDIGKEAALKRPSSKTNNERSPADVGGSATEKQLLLEALNKQMVEEEEAGKIEDKNEKLCANEGVSLAALLVASGKKEGQNDEAKQNGKKFRRYKTDRPVSGKVELVLGDKRRQEEENYDDMIAKKKMNMGFVGMEGVVITCDNSFEAGLQGQFRGAQ